MKQLVWVALAVSALAGCTVGQDDFNCSAGDENALCGSSRTIYEATNGELVTNDKLTYIKDGEKKQITVKELQKVNKGDVGHTLAISENSTGGANSLGVPLSFSYDGDVLRKDVQVMRIWIAPFVDTKDNLHLSSMVYTDIAQRSWELGTEDPNVRAITKSPLLPNKSVKAVVTGKTSEVKEGYQVPPKDKAIIESRFK